MVMAGIPVGLGRVACIAHQRYFDRLQIREVCFPKFEVILFLPHHLL